MLRSKRRETAPGGGGQHISRRTDSFSVVVKYTASSPVSVEQHEDCSQWLTCKIRGGGRYIKVWAPDNDDVLFFSSVII